MVDNICAIATPYGIGAISVIRASGPEAITLVNKIFKGKDLTKVKSHTIHYGHIMDNEEEIDEVLALVYLAPKSFDGENMVEISCHGGIYVTNQVLNTLLKNGFRLAERGEFSKRAFLNHKMDLTQAESIMDIISSSNKIALKSSNASLRSQTSKLIKSFRDKILDILAKIEVNIDYPEYEDAVDVTHEYLKPIVDDLIIGMQQILKNSLITTVAIHGIKTAIIGKPNVGKSSLLNMLLDEDKAIVSSYAGTTRDIVEGTLTLGNVTLHLIDTAGIHESVDYVESIGIERSKKAMDEADLVLLVVDASKELDETDKKLLEMTKDKNRILIGNKMDLKEEISLPGMIYISAKNKEGLDALALRIEEVTKIDSIDSMNGNYLNNTRQTSLMEKAMESLNSAKNAMDLGYDISLIEIDIKNAFDYLGEITGEANPDELITALFTKFCLGK
ncbi:tRNA modification GTPase [Anaeroplasma bactoclasticum]|uniref:tRNA modification GTPase MnmE n=1 Tax=Anaeroplasma bactoclasticum TaxID=2088 RepID=A0A397RS81_9MOLU|nr:tRNA uridine-5-carboxymethylaminomethyl(34) synthesis GTPase MnmE [Anaeroplasma bactoclasticum]RIA75576.1 tRNA modification GTPase [Anaeroplasma bactoclasticum]